MNGGSKIHLSGDNSGNALVVLKKKETIETSGYSRREFPSPLPETIIRVDD